MTEKRNATFTPGPWRFDQSGEYMTYDCIRHNGVVICRMSATSAVAGEYAANARLIAKAPELFEMLEVFEAVIEDGVQPLRDGRIIADIRALLAEVRGEDDHG